MIQIKKEKKHNFTMQITISGHPGSGKTTVAKLLAEEIGYEYHGIGEFMRQLALEKEMTLHDLGLLAEKDDKIDRELDFIQQRLNDKDDFVMDSRLGFYFIPRAFKIYLNVDINTAAKRINMSNRESEKYTSHEEAIQKIKRRIESEKIRYKTHYGIVMNTSFFDVVLDTTNKNPKEIVEEILRIIG
jgi:predicted cytidylate kinase